MKYRLMDILTCPICKHFPLKLQIFKERESKNADKAPYPLCEEFCGLSYTKISEMKDEPLCDTGITKEIETEILMCEKCDRLYPIIDKIPHILPDDFRDKKEDVSFLEKIKSLFSNLVDPSTWVRAPSEMLF